MKSEERGQIGSPLFSELGGLAPGPASPAPPPPVPTPVTRPMRFCRKYSDCVRIGIQKPCRFKGQLTIVCQTLVFPIGTIHDTFITLKEMEMEPDLAKFGKSGSR